MPKPEPSASRGEKRLYKVLASNGLSNTEYAARCEQVAEKFPDQRIAAATMAGLFSLTENPAVAIRALGYVVDSGVEIAEGPFLRRYSPVKAYAMDAGGDLEEWVPLSSALVVGLLATVHLVAARARNLGGYVAELEVPEDAVASRAESGHVGLSGLTPDQLLGMVQNVRRLDEV